MSGEQKTDQQRSQAAEPEMLPFVFPTAEDHPAPPLVDQSPPPTAATRAPFPFPTSTPVRSAPDVADGGDAQTLSQEQQRLLTDTMPGEGPGDD